MVGMSSSREPLRLLRGGLAATVATAVALTGHVLAGGAVPGWLGVLVPWWLSVAVCTVLAGARFTPARMSAAVLGSQVLFHGLFMAGTPGNPATRLVDPPGQHLGHGTHPDHGSHPDLGSHEVSGSHLVPGSPVEHGSHHPAHGVGDLAQHALHGDHVGAPMLLGHLLAAVLTVVLLQRGESLVLGGIDLARTLLDSLLLPVVVPAASLLVAGSGPVAPVVRPQDLRRTQQVVLGPAPRRGPPLVLAA